MNEFHQMNELVEGLPVMAWFVRRKTEDGKPFSNSLRFYDDNGPNTVSEPLVRQSDAEARISDLQAEVERARTRLQQAIDTMEFNAKHMIAEDSLQDAWEMLDMAREQWAVDANSLREVLTLLPALKDNTNGRAALGPKP